MSSACQTNNPTGRQPNTSMQINLFSNPFSFYRRALWSLLPYADPGRPVLYRLTIFICGTFSGLQAEELLRGKERIPPRNPQAGSYLRCAGSCRMSGSVCSSRSVSLSRFVSAFRSLSLPESRSLFRSAFPSLFPFQTEFLFRSLSLPEFLFRSLSPFRSPSQLRESRILSGLLRCNCRRLLRGSSGYKCQAPFPC